MRCLPTRYTTRSPYCRAVDRIKSAGFCRCFVLKIWRVMRRNSSTGPAGWPGLRPGRMVRRRDHAFSVRPALCVARNCRQSSGYITIAAAAHPRAADHARAVCSRADPWGQRCRSFRPPVAARLSPTFTSASVIASPSSPVAGLPPLVSLGVPPPRRPPPPPRPPAP